MERWRTKKNARVVEGRMLERLKQWLHIGGEPREAAPVEFPPEVELELSHIASGLVAELIDGEAVLIYKGPASEADHTLSRSQRVAIEAEALPRDEFPAVRLGLRFDLGEGRAPAALDYMAAADSSDETAFLRTIVSTGRLRLVFIEPGGTIRAGTVVLGPAQLGALERALREAGAGAGSPP